jgi:hypothetical protein
LTFKFLLTENYPIRTPRVQMLPNTNEPLDPMMASFIEMSLVIARELSKRLDAEAAARAADAAENGTVPVADTAPVPADARLVKDLQASTDQMLPSASIAWQSAQRAAHELGLSYDALGQRLRRHPPPQWAAHKNSITGQWQVNAPGLRMWWAVGEA